MTNEITDMINTSAEITQMFLEKAEKGISEVFGFEYTRDNPEFIIAYMKIMMESLK